MILYMYIAPGQGLKPLDEILMSTGISCHLSFVASFKNISLKSNFIHFFFMILYMYIAQGHGQTAPRGQSFMSKEMLSLHSLVASEKQMSLKSDFIHLFHDLINIYSPRAGSRQPPGDKILMSTERLYHFTHLLKVSKKCL